MPTAVGFAQCNYQLMQTGLTRPAYITFGVDPSGGDAQTVADSVHGAFGASGSLKTLFDNSVTMTGVRVALGTDGTGDLVYVKSTSDAGGGGALTTLPPNCAVLMHKTTGIGGRRGRGRMYLPWTVGEGSVDEAGVITGSIITSHNAACLAWRLALTAAGVPLVLMHAEGKTAKPEPTAVTSMSCDARIATQRRRIGR